MFCRKPYLGSTSPAPTCLLVKYHFYQQQQTITTKRTRNSEEVKPLPRRGARCEMFEMRQKDKLGRVIISCALRGRRPSPCSDGQPTVCCHPGLHTAHCTLHTAHCTLHTAHCTLTDVSHTENIALDLMMSSRTSPVTPGLLHYSDRSHFIVLCMHFFVCCDASSGSRGDCTFLAVTQLHW